MTRGSREIAKRRLETQPGEPALADPPGWMDPWTPYGSQVISAPFVRLKPLPQGLRAGSRYQSW